MFQALLPSSFSFTHVAQWNLTNLQAGAHFVFSHPQDEVSFRLIVL
jgi:hypothetical protein